MGRIYDTAEWATARAAALRRDGNRCVPAMLLGGDCAGVLDVHHVRPVREGGDPYRLGNLLTACRAHHPRLEAVARALRQGRDRPERRVRQRANAGAYRPFERAA